MYSDLKRNGEPGSIFGNYTNNSTQPLQFGQSAQPLQFVQPAQPLQFVQPAQPLQFVQPAQLLQFGQLAQPLQFGQLAQPLQFGWQFVQPAQLLQFVQLAQPLQFVQPAQPLLFGQPAQLLQFGWMFGQPAQPLFFGQPAQPLLFGQLAQPLQFGWQFGQPQKDIRRGNLVVPDGAKIRGIKPGRADDYLCSPNEAMKYVPLFEHEPCVDDIQQTDLSDCYLLGSLISLLNSPEYGPNFIMDMMIDNGDGTVTVRLYKFKYTESPDRSVIRSIESVYCRVQKGGVVKDPISALWVQVIENAFARLGCNKYFEKDRYYKNLNNWGYSERQADVDSLVVPRKLDDIKDGFPAYAMFALTGRITGGYDYSYDCGGKFKITAQDIKQIYEETEFATIGFKTNTNLVRAKHAYSIYNVFKKGAKTYITIINPWRSLQPIGRNFADFKEDPNIEVKETINDKVLTFELNKEFLGNIMNIDINEECSERNGGAQKGNLLYNRNKKIECKKCRNNKDQINLGKRYRCGKCGTLYKPKSELVVSKKKSGRYLKRKYMI